MLEQFLTLAGAANITALLSALIIAIGYPHFGFPVACVASVLFGVYGYSSGELSFTYVNVIFFLVNFLGSYNWIKKKINESK